MTMKQKRLMLMQKCINNGLAPTFRNMSSFRRIHSEYAMVGDKAYHRKRYWLARRMYLMAAEVARGAGRRDEYLVIADALVGKVC